MQTEVSLLEHDFQPKLIELIWGTCNLDFKAKLPLTVILHKTLNCGRMTHTPISYVTCPFYILQ